MSKEFKGQETHVSNWSVKEERELKEEDRALVRKAKVVRSRHGLSCRFNLKEGTWVFIPMARKSKVVVGQVLDLSKARVQVLEKPGEPERYKIVY